MTGEIAQNAEADSIGPDASLLLVDDDGPFLRRLARAMETRGFAVEIAESVAEGLAKARQQHRNMPLSTCGFRMATGWM
jgi:two-component system response regulator RegA